MATDNLQRLKAMFQQMVVNKNIDVMAKYYDPGFILYSNGMTMHYQDYYLGHKKVYKTPIQYTVQFDSKTITQSGNNVAARMFITTKMPKQKATKIQVMMIAQYRKNKIYRLWELTYPNWTKLKTLHSAFSKKNQVRVQPPACEKCSLCQSNTTCKSCCDNREGNCLKKIKVSPQCKKMK